MGEGGAFVLQLDGLAASGIEDVLRGTGTPQGSSEEVAPGGLDFGVGADPLKGGETAGTGEATAAARAVLEAVEVVVGGGGKVELTALGADAHESAEKDGGDEGDD